LKNDKTTMNDRQPFSKFYYREYNGYTSTFKYRLSNPPYRQAM